MTKYTRENPARLLPDRKPWQIVPDAAWWQARPDAVEVTWTARVVCTGRKTHRPTVLGGVARVVFKDGTVDLELSTPTDVDMVRWRERRPDAKRGEVPRQAIIAPLPARNPGEGSRNAWTFTCPRCRIDLRIGMGRGRRLAEVVDLPTAELDVSVLV